MGFRVWFRGGGRGGNSNSWLGALRVQFGLRASARVLAVEPINWLFAENSVGRPEPFKEPLQNPHRIL